MKTDRTAASRNGAVRLIHSVCTWINMLWALRVYAGFTSRAPPGVCPLRGSVYISLRRTANGYICTLNSGGVLALHL
jgi:hypothetical protein